LTCGADSAKATLQYASVPLYFEPNAGQFDARVQFVARASGYSMFLAPGASNPPITVTVNVSPGAASPLVNQARVASSSSVSAAAGSYTGGSFNTTGRVTLPCGAYLNRSCEKEYRLRLHVCHSCAVPGDT